MISEMDLINMNVLSFPEDIIEEMSDRIEDSMDRACAAFMGHEKELYVCKAFVDKKSVVLNFYVKEKKDSEPLLFDSVTYCHQGVKIRQEELLYYLSDSDLKRIHTKKWT